MVQPRVIFCGLGAHLKGPRWEADGSLRIGRMPDIEVIFTNEEVMMPKVEVVPGDQGWLLHNPNTVPGILVNGLPVLANYFQLKTNDVIRYGGMSLQVLESPVIPLPETIESLQIQAVAHRTWDEALEALDRYDSRRLPHAKHVLTLVRAGYHLRHGDSLEDFLRSTLTDAVQALGAQRGCVVLADEQNGQLQGRAACSVDPRKNAKDPYSRTLAQRAFERNESLLCRDVSATAELQEAPSLRLKTMASVICAALRTPRKKLGILHLDRGPLQEPFTEEDFFLADAIAASVSAGIEAAQLVDNQRRLFLQTVTALARAVELRDRYTGNHTQRVTEYALMLAEELKLSPAELQQIRIGAPLHDIGKIGISDTILQKPGRLTKSEFEAMKVHTLTGADMLAPIPELSPVVPIVRHHHERWDGNGYPDQLKGEAIAPVARVVAVADAFDAMTSDRPYRPALSLNQAFDEVVQNAGSHFAPECAAALMRLRPRIEARFRHPSMNGGH